MFHFAFIHPKVSFLWLCFILPPEAMKLGDLLIAKKICLYSYIFGFTSIQSALEFKHNIFVLTKKGREFIFAAANSDCSIGLSINFRVEILSTSQLKAIGSFVHYLVNALVRDTYKLKGFHKAFSRAGWKI